MALNLEKQLLFVCFPRLQVAKSVADNIYRSTALTTMIRYASIMLSSTSAEAYQDVDSRSMWAYISHAYRLYF